MCVCVCVFIISDIRSHLINMEWWCHVASKLTMAEVFDTSLNLHHQRVYRRTG